MNRMRIISTVFYAVCCYLKNKILHKKTKNKNVLILFQQIFGDAILVTDSLKYYEKLYPEAEGYHVTFVCKPNILEFMQSVLPLPSNISFEVLDFKRIQTDKKYFKEMVKKYSSDYGILIVPGTSYSPELFTITSTAERRIGLLPSIPRTKPKSLVWLQKNAYTEVIRPNKELMMLQRHRLLLNYLGLDNIEAKLPCLLPQQNTIQDDYCVICPGSSMEFKVWPMERFAEVADYLIEKYNYNVYLSGGRGEEKYADQLKALSRNPNRISSKIGNTTFEEWSALVQYATLVIGNDSATVHLAAAARTPAICIAGVYDKMQFFPYAVDKLEEGEFMPTTLYTSMPCEYCRTMSYFAGYQNEVCQKRIEEKQCVCCIDSIKVSDVINQIDVFMK